MVKRRSIAVDEGDSNITPKKRKIDDPTAIAQLAGTPNALETPSRTRSILKRGTTLLNGDETPRSLRKVLFTEPETPHEREHNVAQLDSPLTAALNADHSARRKSARKLIGQSLDDGDDDGVIDGEEALAEAILDDEEEDDEENALDSITVAQGTPTKSNRPRGRPKGRRRERTPTPPQDLPPHELYFFQNRPGGSKTSSNTLTSNLLLNHEDYFAQIKAISDSHGKDREKLASLHMHSFDQWAFELEEEFNICLYGYGSKRSLVMDFAEHLHAAAPNSTNIIVVNGYVPTLTLKDILSTICNNVVPKSQAAKLPAQPAALLDLIFTTLTDNPSANPVYLIVHSIDAAPMRKTLTQSTLSRLASHPGISLIATADTLSFPLMWDISLRSQYRFLFHDTTTFTPFDKEIDVVDEVNSLLGRSGRRVGGKDGVIYVLRSLPENARNLFRILVAEQLALADSDGGDGQLLGMNGIAGEEEDEEDILLGSNEDGHLDGRMDVDEPATPSKRRNKKPKKVTKTAAPVRIVHEGIEYRTLYHKAVEEFVCSSEMGFRTLLKEFHDHEMIESKKDGLGTERLSVPFGREELEGLLEELV